MRPRRVSEQAIDWSKNPAQRMFSEESPSDSLRVRTRPVHGVTPCGTLCESSTP